MIYIMGAITSALYLIIISIGALQVIHHPEPILKLWGLLNMCIGVYGGSKVTYAITRILRNR